MGGKSKDEYKAVAKFFKFLSDPERQAIWHQTTGYLPITLEAYELTKKSGFYEKNPGTDVSVKQMIVKTTDKSRGVRLGNFVQIRDIIDEELEGVWAGKKTAQGSARHGGRARQRADREVRQDREGVTPRQAPPGLTAMAMEKRVRFRSWWLPYALIAPQMAVTLVFFFWPAGQALYQSLFIENAFGGDLQFVGLDNFRELFNDEHYLASFKVTAVSSPWPWPASGSPFRCCWRCSPTAWCAAPRSTRRS